MARRHIAAMMTVRGALLVLGGQVIGWTIRTWAPSADGTFVLGKTVGTKGAWCP